MDRVLLKRLLGAGVMVALAVIVLPLFLQGEGYKAALHTDIPARPQPPQPLDTASRVPPPEVRELMESPPPLPMEQAPLPRSEPTKEAVGTGAAKPAPKPAAPLVPEAKPTPTPQAAGGKSAPEISKPEGTPSAAGKPVASPIQPPSGGAWMIQLGSFSAETNAQQLHGQVQRVGIPCQIDPLDIDGRRVWRVRAGPFASQAEADAALKRLQNGLKLGGLVIQVR
ncbi:MAG: SPOR domain-containing protein [Halothiobacillaceae bacterium]